MEQFEQFDFKDSALQKSLGRRAQEVQYFNEAQREWGVSGYGDIHSTFISLQCDISLPSLGPLFAINLLILLQYRDRTVAVQLKLRPARRIPQPAHLMLCVCVPVCWLSFWLEAYALTLKIFTGFFNYNLHAGSRKRPWISPVRRLLTGTHQFGQIVIKMSVKVCRSPSI